VSLNDWLANGWLVAHKTSKREIRDLLGVADRDLSDCKAKGLSADWKLNIAYNAGLQLSSAALAAAGYRPARDSHHYRVIQSLKETIRADAALIDLFEAFRKKRNLGNYERAGMISEKEAKAMVDLAQQLRTAVEAWIRANHSKLL
jgi:hypothetical protein